MFADNLYNFFLILKTWKTTFVGKWTKDMNKDFSKKIYKCPIHT